MYQNHVGINLTETKFQLIEISYKNNSFYLENVDQSIFKEPLALSHNENELITVLQDSFNKIISRNRISSKFVSFSLANNFFNIFEIPIEHTLTKNDLNDHIKWELSVLFPESNCENFLIQHVEVNKTSIRKENKAIVFALDKSLIAVINKFCRNNNLKLKYVDNAHLASNAFLHINSEYTKNDITFSIYIDQNYSSVSALEGIYPFFFKVFNSNRNNIFYDLDTTIANLVNLGVDFSLVKHILLCGQNITDEFISILNKKYGLPLKKINPFERLKTEEAVSKNTLYNSQYNSFTAATGIAIRII